MKKTAVWQTLVALPPADRKDIALMLQTPLFNRSTEVTRLFQLLQTCIDKKTTPERAALLRALYPGETPDAAKARGVLFRLNNIVKFYLINKKLQTNAIPSKIFLAEAYGELELEALYDETLEEAKSALEAIARRDTEWYDLRFRLFEGLSRQSAGTARTQALHFQEMSDSLEKAFILRKLKLSCEQLSHQSVYNTLYDAGMLEALLQYLESAPKWLQQSDIALYYRCCMALLHPEEIAHFNSLKPLLLRMDAVLSPKECRDAMLLAVNFCIRQLNSGNALFAQEGLELYKYALDKGFLFENGLLSRFTFRNIVGMGLKMKAYDWVAYFITHYKDKLPAEHRESMASFNLARLAYIRRDYREAVLLLQKADYGDLLLNLAARVLLLKIYYENQEWRSLDAALEATKMFLRRKKIIAYHRDNYQNIIRYFEKLLALNRFDAAEKNAFRSAVEQEPRLTEREWFLEQAT